MKKISIIIPVYNDEKYIAQCIQSCVDQTYENLEIIVVNDGSTDRTHDIISKFITEIKYFQKPNGGTASAHNLALKYATGDYIYFVGSDDYIYDKDSLKELYEYKPKDDNTVGYSNGILVNENGKKVGQNPEWNYNKYNHIEQCAIMYDHFFASLPTSLIPRSLIDKLKTVKELDYAEDYDFWLRALMIHGISLIKIPITTMCIRQHDKQLTRTVKNAKEKRDKIRSDVMSQLDEGLRNEILEAYSHVKTPKTIRWLISSIYRRVIKK